MKKKLEVRDLKLGMYVAALDRPWLETPFMFQGFRLINNEQLETLEQYCVFVYIETALSHEISHETRKQTPVRREPSLKPSGEGPDRTQIEFEMLRTQANPQAQKQVYHDQSEVEEEIAYVKDIYHSTSQLIDEVLDDARIRKILNIAGIRSTVTKLTKSVIRNPDALMLFAQIKNKDSYTAQHSLRTSILALTLGRQLGMDIVALEALGVGTLLHDIGKIEVPDEILNKPEALTPDEVELMKLHVPNGLNILRNQAPGLPTVALDVVGWHHERYDGSGYITGAKGNEISQFGHIGAIVDHFDAVTSDRPWRTGAAHHTTLMNMYDSRGQTFHPELVEQFIRCMGVYPIGSVVQMNTGEAGVVITRNRERHLRPRVVIAAKADNSLYKTHRTVDLTKDRSPDGRMFEIVRVLEPGEHIIDPILHLPIPKAA